MGFIIGVGDGIDALGFFRADEAYTLIEFLGQLRDVLMEAYGDEIADMLREATQREYDSQDKGREVDGELT